jgi:hypothetical protein
MAIKLTNCIVEGCEHMTGGVNNGAKGYCRFHYNRLRKSGDPTKGRSIRGAGEKFMMDLLRGSPIEKCVIWPYGKDENGYGTATHPKTKRRTYAHRIVCEYVNGPAPSVKHQAAHNCGMGRKGCCNPNHLRWATPKENSADKIKHGTLAIGDMVPTSKLNLDKVSEIIDLIGKYTQTEIAAMYGISQATVSHIKSRRTWAHYD